MFITYLFCELRRRMRQVIFASLGMAIGIGLVIAVTAASSDDPETKVAAVPMYPWLLISWLMRAAREAAENVHLVVF